MFGNSVKHINKLFLVDKRLECIVHEHGSGEKGHASGHRRYTTCFTNTTVKIDISDKSVYQSCSLYNTHNFHTHPSHTSFQYRSRMHSPSASSPWPSPDFLWPRSQYRHCEKWMECRECEYRIDQPNTQSTQGGMSMAGRPGSFSRWPQPFCFERECDSCKN